MVENDLGMENLVKVVTEESLDSSGVENLSILVDEERLGEVENHVGEGVGERVEKNDVDVDMDDAVGSTADESKNLVESIGEQRLGEEKEVVDDLMHSAEAKRVEVNDVVMDDVGSLSAEESENLMNSVGEKRLGENCVVVDSVEGKMVEGSGNLMNSVDKRRLGESTPVEEKMAKEKRLGVSIAVGDSVEEKMAEAVLDSVEEKMVEEKRLGENTPVVDNMEERMAEEKRFGDNTAVVDSVEEKMTEENDVSVDFQEDKKMEEENVSGDFVEEKKMEENSVGVSSIGVSSDSLKDTRNSVGEKRGAENSFAEDLLGKNKRAKVDTCRDMKRVAEIVLVLSAMGNMRGGRSPTAVEKQIMVEARQKLAGLCEEIAPKDIVSRDAVKVVIEDLGLNRSRDQRPGIRPPMMSIKEKWQLSKKKMEDSKKFAIQSGIYSPQMLQTGFGTRNESHGAFSQATQRFPDRPNQNAVLAGVSESAASVNHANEALSTLASRGQLSSPLEKDASSLPLPRTEPLHFRIDGRPNVSSYVPNLRANLPGEHVLGKPTTNAPQLQAGVVGRVGLPNKVPDGTPAMVISQAPPTDTRDRNSNNSVPHSAYGNLQAVQPPVQNLSYMHNEIAKSVQRFLYPRLPEHPSWTPPSTDYMTKSLSCQACKDPVNDAESLLVCDSCEKGNHLKCLQSYNQKGIPKGEWHCPTCLLGNQGKPLPPKYGRVTRSNTAQKASPNAATVQTSVEKKADNSDQKVNHQKPTANGTPSHVGHTGNIHVASAADLKIQAANSSGNKVKMAEGPLSDHKLPPKEVTGSNQQFQSHEPSSCKPAVSVLDPKPLPKCEPAESCHDEPFEAGTGTCPSSENPCTSQDVGKEASEGKPGFDVRKDGQDAAQTVSVGNTGVGNGARDCMKSSLDGVHTVDWVGDILQIVDEKAFYRSCHINGMVYKIQDHALFRINNGNLRPSKLQALWEDTKTGSKWAIVNSCYFPADLPEVVGRPCSPETNEVYESNHGSTVRVGLVQGPCGVLPPNKFKEESETRIHSDKEHRPIFLCKWFYDESKGLFRPVTD